MAQCSTDRDPVHVIELQMLTEMDFQTLAYLYPNYLVMFFFLTMVISLPLARSGQSVGAD